MKFEQFLSEKFMVAEPWVLDDDMPDRFQDWLARLDAQEIIDYAEEWGDLSKVNRVEVINHADASGRAYTYWHPIGEIQVKTQLQDGGKTLKIFITPK